VPERVPEVLETESAENRKTPESTMQTFSQKLTQHASNLNLMLLHDDPKRMVFHDLESLALKEEKKTDVEA
jgi:hypothetical protein